MDKFDASKSLASIVEAIQNAQKLGLAVCVKDGKLKVINTVAYSYDVDHGRDPTKNDFAYAEFDGFGDFDG